MNNYLYFRTKQFSVYVMVKTKIEGRSLQETNLYYALGICYLNNDNSDSVVL